MHISLFKSFKPQSYSSSDNIDDCYLSGARYVNVDADTLYYTGYDYIDHDGNIARAYENSGGIL